MRKALLREAETRDNCPDFNFGDYVTLDRPFYLSEPQFPYLKIGGFICLTKVLGHDEVANVKGLCCTCVRDY